jgi:hypothetical protein
MNSGSTHSYLMVCRCGREVRVGTGQAGTLVRCSRCGAAIELPSLSRLRQLPIVAGLVELREAFQFSLQTLFGIVAFFALFTVFGKAVGFHWLFFMIPVCAVLGFLGALWPRFVTYSLVLGGILLLLGTPTIVWVLRARENARSNQCTYNLKEIGTGMGHARNYFPDFEPPDDQNWLAENAARQTQIAKP